MTTLVTRVRDRATATPNAVAMRHKRLGVWQELTWTTYWDRIQTVGHALLALGIEPGDRVGIQSENRPEWLILDLATVAARGTTVGLYPTNPEAEVRYLLTHSGARIHLAEDQEQLDKALAAADDCPELERIVYLESRGIKGRYDDPRLLFWDDLVRIGAEHRAAHPELLDERIAAAESNDIVTLVYTSGTTGPPKGAMLSAGNVEFAAETLMTGEGAISPVANERDQVLSYLPLCHVAERFFTTWFSTVGGVQVNFAESIDTVPQNLHEVQPTLFFAVPRIWEKLLASVRIKADSASWLKRRWARFWLARADRLGATLVANGGRHTVSSRLVYAVGWLFFFRALKDRLGLRKVRYASCGAAPVAPEVLTFFMGIGVPMHELYGMTENTAIATRNVPGRVKVGTVGEPYPAIELRIDDDSGEILTRHPAVFAGYWRDPEATARTVDADGWLHTGDVGEWVDGTHVRITDRLKDIIITAGGKNVAPSEIENALKASPYIKEAVVVGDGKKYLTGLIGIELDTVGEWAQQRQLSYTTYRDLSERPEVIELIDSIVRDVNERFSSVEQLKKFRMLPKELDHEDGELTATQKVKRSAISKTFGDLISSMYSPTSSGGAA